MHRHFHLLTPSPTSVVAHSPAVAVVHAAGSESAALAAIRSSGGASIRVKDQIRIRKRVAGPEQGRGRSRAARPAEQH
jgi:hypothetical protein